MVVGGAFGLAPDAGLLGTVRTAVLSALAVGCALLNRPGRFSALGKLAYPLLALTGLKLAVVDLRVLDAGDAVRRARVLRNGARARAEAATGLRRSEAVGQRSKFKVQEFKSSKLIRPGRRVRPVMRPSPTCWPRLSFEL